MAFDTYEVMTIEAYRISRSRTPGLGSTTTETLDFSFSGYIDYVAGQKLEVGPKFQEDTTHILMTNWLTQEQSEKLRLLKNYELKESGNRYRILDVDNLTKIGSSQVQHWEILLQYVEADQTKRW